MSDLKQWFSATELMGIGGLPITLKGINQKAKKESWKSRPRKGRGGGKEFHIDSLPMDAKNTLLILNNRAQNPEQKVALKEGIVASPRANKKFTYCPESLWSYYDRQKQNKKDKAREKLDLLNAVLITFENSDLTLVDSFKKIGEIENRPYKTMFNWYYGKGSKRGIKDYERCDWLAALIPGHHGKTSTVECSPDAWEYYKKIYLQLEQPTAADCYRYLEAVVEKHKWIIPSECAMRRRMKREVPRTIQVLMREGEHAVMSIYPPQERDVLTLHALEWINGDGYQHNVFVKWPDGTIGRPKTWFWQDIHSRKMLAWRTDQTENADQIILCTGDLIEKYGCPSDVTIDNTRAAANKWVTGRVKNRYRFKVKEDDPIGIFPAIGCKVHWTTVNSYSDAQKSMGWGQAKPIERAFGVGGLGEWVDKAPEFRGAYTGPNTTAKPANYAKTAVPLDVFLEVLERQMHAWNARTGRRTQTGEGIYSFDQVFEKSYAESSIRKPTEEQRRMWMLSGEGVRVKNDGSFKLEAGSAIGKGSNRYQHDVLYQHEGEKIIIRFDPMSLHTSVYAYTVEGEYLCECDCIDRTGFGDRLAARQHQRARKEMLKHVKAAANAEVRMDDIEAAEYLPETTTPAPVSPAVIQGMFARTQGANALHIDEELDADEIAQYEAKYLATITQIREEDRV